MLRFRTRGSNGGYTIVLRSDEESIMEEVNLYQLARHILSSIGAKETQANLEYIVNKVLKQSVIEMVRSQELEYEINMGSINW